MQRNLKAASIGMACLRIAAALCVLAAYSNPCLAQQQGTQAERQACTPDVFRLCSDFIPDADKITACLKKSRNQLSPDCKLVFSGKLKQEARGDVSADSGAVTSGRRGALR
jgi:hypothetical protein